jgi:hypothetical protein
MIRIIPLLFFISSCSYISYSQVIPMIKVATIGATNETIGLLDYSNAEYSFAKIRIGRSANANLTLATINKGIFQWVSADNEKIYTFNGKIIKTSGIGRNMNYISYSDFSLDPKIIDILDVELYDPHAIVQQKSKIVFSGYQVITYLESPVKTKYFQELVSTEEFKWKYMNEYWVDLLSNRVIRSKQSIHPNFPDLEIEYFYK